VHIACKILIKHLNTLTEVAPDIISHTHSCPRPTSGAGNGHFVRLGVHKKANENDRSQQRARVRGIGTFEL